jgi:hypothetical protein
MNLVRFPYVYIVTIIGIHESIQFPRAIGLDWIAATYESGSARQGRKGNKIEDAAEQVTVRILTFKL